MKQALEFFKKNKLITAVLLILIFFLSYNLLKSADEGLYFYVEQDVFFQDIKVDGIMQSLNSFVIKAPSNIWGNARIVKLVPEGETVNEDDFLIQFDTSEFQQRMLEAKNKLETTLAALASTQANIKSQMAELESNIKLEEYSFQQSKLRAGNAVYESENKRKEIELNLKKAEISFEQIQQKIEAAKKINQASLRQAELEVEQAQLKVNRAEDDLKKLTIMSPAEGLVVYKEVWEGDKMAKLKVGYSPWRGQALLEIPSHNKMKAKVKVDEVNISSIAKGQKAEIELDAVPDTIYTGLVTEIASLAYKDRKTKKKVFDVELNMDSTDARLKPGMTAHCRIIVEKLDSVLAIPIDAVSSEGENSVVYLKNGSKKIIKTGVSNSDFIIVEEGLEEGSTIRLPEGSAVQRQEPAKKKNSRKTNNSGEVVTFFVN